MAFISISSSIAGINIPGKLGKIASGPLSLLYNNNKSITTKKYPLDLGTDATKTHYVQFSISEVIPVSIRSDEIPEGRLKFEGFSKMMDAMMPEATEPVTNLYHEEATFWTTPKSIFGAGAAEKLFPAPFQTQVTDPTKDVTSLNKAAGDLFQMKNGGTWQEKGLDLLKTAGKATSEVLEKGLKISPRRTKLEAIVSLYMPDTINAEYGSDYAEFSLTEELGSVLAGLQVVQQIAKNQSDNVANAKNDIVSAISDMGKDPALAMLVGNISGLKGLSNLVIKGHGKAINPKVQMIYKGIDLRNFQLTFTFSPKSAQESREIDDIMALFKYHYAPTLNPGDDAVNSMFFIPPSIFEVKFMHDGSENTHLPKYGECVLSNITIDYAPNGFAVYEDGAPVQSIMMLQFKEVEIIHRAKLDKGELR